MKNQLHSTRPVYICFCDTTQGLGKHYDKPRFVFNQCPSKDCQRLAFRMDPRCDISIPSFDVSLTWLNIDYIFTTTNEKELHATIPQEMIRAFTDCASEYGSLEAMSWSQIVDAYNDVYPENNFSASHLENYFLQLAFLVTVRNEHQ